MSKANNSNNNKETLLKDFIGQDLADFCDTNYSKEYGDLFRNNLSHNLDTTLKSCKYHKDKRTTLEYGKDLLSGWILEDFLKLKLEQNHSDLVVERIGADANRKFLSGTQVSSDADLQLIINNKKTIIEVISDYNGFWEVTGKGHLRDSKIKYLKNYDLDTYLLAVDVKNSKFQFINVKIISNIKFIKSHYAYGGKPAYEINIDKERFKDINNI